MDTPMSTQELQLCQHLIELPRQHAYRYGDAASRDLLYNLFWSMAGGKPEYMRLFFPDGKLTPKGVLSLSQAQGAVEGAEYTEAARGHMVKIAISPGNSGCCDCGDLEAWKLPLFCTIHSERGTDRSKGKGKEPSALPEDLVANIRMTISRVLDFICDVISCAPEQLRQPKTKGSIELDEKTSRLTSTYCGGDVESPGEYALLLWNDEKHTVTEVQDQVARACSTTQDEGYNRAVETDSLGRSILKYDASIENLLQCANVLEHIKITVTIRSSRDTFREQMCGTMIEWLNDICGCTVGNDANILRMVVCEELLKVWRKGSPGTHATVGKDGIEDEEKFDHDHLDPHTAFFFMQRARVIVEAGNATAVNFIETDDEEDEDDMEDHRTPSSGEEDDEDEEDDDDEDVMMIDTRPDTSADVNMGDWRQGAIGEALEEDEATMAGYPPPPPPPPVPRRTARDRDLTPSDSDTAEPLIAPTVYAKANLEVPKTPGLLKQEKTAPPKPGRYWVEAPAAYMERGHAHPFEDVFQRVRLDWLILFDLRMWKKVRNDLRSLYISTVVTIPEFKRILGLRFAALYTTLAQLYLIADREPDHSIINISLQMLTTPSITAEVGHPWEVSSSAVLGFDTGSVTNRRMYHFYVDMKFLLGSIHVQELIVNSIGAERARFTQSEIKDEFSVVKFVVEEQNISFHHALHYTLSWLIECGKHMPLQQLCGLLSFTAQDLKMKPRSMGRKTMPKRDYTPEDYLIAAFDYPLRVCTWLAQIKAGMWTSMVTCDPSRVLASVVDRFGMEKWIKGFFEQTSAAQDETQHLDVVEDMVHLLIVMLSDRTCLIPAEDDHETHLKAMRRDIIHVLCFRPMSFNEICNKLPDKFHEQDDFYPVLDEVATFKPPEGVSDVGTFELRPELIEEIDPYIAHYNKNQREESEAAYRNLLAARTGKPAEEIVYEPRLPPIPSGAFVGLASFTGTGMFAQIIYYSLLYPLVAAKLTPKVPFTRVETFLQVVLHLVLVAISEDRTDEKGSNEGNSFVYRALTTQARKMMSSKEEFKACHPKIWLILKRMKQKLPTHFDAAYLRLGIPVDRVDTASPANAHNAEEERERKKKAALDRQAKVMAQFQQQQKSFLEMQGDIDWGDEELDDIDDANPIEERKNFWKYPRGTCILCQEDTDDGRLYGTFALFTESKILRQTDFQDPDFVREAANTPINLDRSAEDTRPFGLAHENRKEVEKVDSQGNTFIAEKQGIGKGFPAKLCRSGPVAVGCGHIMHFSCFDMYVEATVRRHGHQIARHHPEVLDRLEFVCPLCKALGNAFLPITWDGKEEAYPGVLQTDTDLSSFIDSHGNRHRFLFGTPLPSDQVQSAFANYVRARMPDSLVEGSEQLVLDATYPSGVRTPSTRTQGTFSDSFSDVATPSSSARSRSPSESPNGGKDLITAYRRLRDTLRQNKLGVRASDGEGRDDLYGSDTLARSVGYSISAAEIQQRGVGAQYGSTLIERIPEQTLIQLRILSETVASYISIGGLRFGGENLVNEEFRRASENQHCQLFIAQYISHQESGYSYTVARKYSPLLSQDPFIYLCESMFGMVVAQDMDVMHLVRLCYLAEIVKVVYHVSRNIPVSKWLEHTISRNHEDPALNNFAGFCNSITVAGMNASSEVAETSESSPNIAFDQPGLDSLEGLHSFVKKYALAFLRKTAILLHVHSGVDFNSNISTAPEADELTRLTAALRLPSFDEMCTALTPLSTQYGWPARTEELVLGWIHHQTVWSQLSNDDKREPLPISAQVSHPGIFELVGLPKNYDTLIEECAKRRCPKTGKDLADPIVCLMCGDIFCGQTMCCLMEYREEGPNKPLVRIGGGQQHMLFKCQGNVGIFINIRKCAIIYLHRTSGSFSNAPYIDKWGETDVGLRHGRQLFLNQKRYDSMIRDMWLRHGIPSFISRKLEADINNGGWETI
ncbi:putative e3 ubiquitin-protein ligase ubr1 protein [Eutypa lata UCREL1]|uniref:E3 ubiquitin-protein ligase n=1 Tax=Eutypa lata (strain UCR-EL1) TaxID=1287681 RepID=M7S7W3_EUTLA|nr:putative e3 ubiquitin-protein ligase ubr1 protein [Eutypa lata UCREL1]